MTKKFNGTKITLTILVSFHILIFGAYPSPIVVTVDQIMNNKDRIHFSENHANYVGRWAYMQANISFLTLTLSTIRARYALTLWICPVIAQVILFDAVTPV